MTSRPSRAAAEPLSIELLLAQVRAAQAQLGPPVAPCELLLRISEWTIPGSVVVLDTWWAPDPKPLPPDELWTRPFRLHHQPRWLVMIHPTDAGQHAPAQLALAAVSDTLRRQQEAADDRAH